MDLMILLQKFLISIGYVLSFRTLKKKLGLLNAEMLFQVLHQLLQKFLNFLWHLGVPIFEGYGMTENCGFATSK